MARAEITGRKTVGTIAATSGARRSVPDNDADAYSVQEFCRRHRLSPQLFYKRPDLMPDSFYVGTRRLISREAAARWRAEREAERAPHRND